MSTDHDDSRLQPVKDDIPRERGGSRKPSTEEKNLVRRSDTEEITVEAKIVSVIERIEPASDDGSKKNKDSEVKDDIAAEKPINNRPNNTPKKGQEVEEEVEWEREQDEEPEEDEEFDEDDEEEGSSRGWQPPPHAKPLKPVFGGVNKPNKPR